MLTMKPETVTCDVRDHILDRLRTMPEAWHKLPEKKQRELAAEAMEMAQRVTAEAKKLVIAGTSVSSTTGNLEKVDITKNGIVLKVMLNSLDPVRHAIMDARGGDISISIVGASTVDLSTRPARIDLDQPQMFTPESDPDAGDDAPGPDSEDASPDDAPFAEAPADAETPEEEARTDELVRGSLAEAMKRDTALVPPEAPQADLPEPASKPRSRRGKKPVA